MVQTHSLADPKSGFDPKTMTFRSLRPPLDLPPEDLPVNAAEYVFSLQANNSLDWANSAALIDSATGLKLSFSDFAKRARSLAFHLQNVAGLSRNDVAFVLSANSINVPILYFALLSLGVVFSAGNPVSTEAEISRQIELSKPTIAFATSASAHKLPELKRGTIILDSPEFDSIIATGVELNRVIETNQSDVAAILFSSGTTGKVKGVMLTHRNLIAASAVYKQQQPNLAAVVLFTVPFFHVFGLCYIFKAVALSEAVVVAERFDLGRMLRAVEGFRVTQLVVVPPVVLAMTKSELCEAYDLRSLKGVACGGAPLGKEVIVAFNARFPAVLLWQGYGMTESTAGAFRPAGPEEIRRWGSSGRLVNNLEAKIIDLETGDALPPGKQGELWIRGPTIMKGYVGDPEATAATLASDGWLRTGDICCIDKEGFLFVVDRLKELIKHKGYQVAPAELEQLLQSHPEIIDAAVVPYPNEATGEVPVAFVVKQAQSRLHEREVIDFVQKQVAPYKKIWHVVFVNSIPKSPAGKILRRNLRNMVLSAPLSKL